MKKKIIIPIIIFSIIIIALISYNVITDYQEEQKIRTEQNSIINLMQKDSLNTDEINEILNRRIATKKEYLAIEEATKKYTQDLISIITNINYLTSSDNLSYYLSVSNLKNDNKEFSQSLNSLDDLSSQLDDQISNYNKMINEETVINSYLPTDTKSYYQTFYHELISLTQEIISTDDINTIKDNLNNKISIYKEIYSFLSTNKDNWHIENEELVFISSDTNTSEELLEVYNNYIKELNSDE